MGIGAIILSAIYWIFGFLRMGTTGLTARRMARGDRGEVAALLTRALMIGVAGGLAVIALQVPLFWAPSALAPASAEVEALARDYMAIRIWSAPAAIAHLRHHRLADRAGTHARGAGDPVLDERAEHRAGPVVRAGPWLGRRRRGLCHLPRRMERVGAGPLAVPRCAVRAAGWRDWARVFDAVRAARGWRRSTRDILIRSLLLQAMFVSFLFLGARFGDVTLAANQVLMQFLHITAYALDGFAFAAEALVGQAMGARQSARLRRGALLTSLWGLLIAVAHGGRCLRWRAGRSST